MNSESTFILFGQFQGSPIKCESNFYWKLHLITVLKISEQSDQQFKISITVFYATCNVSCVMRCLWHMTWRHNKTPRIMRFSKNMSYAMVYTFQEGKSTCPPLPPTLSTKSAFFFIPSCTNIELDANIWANIMRCSAEVQCILDSCF